MSALLDYGYVAIGGALGASARYFCSQAAQTLEEVSFLLSPTVLVNAVGSFLIGLVAAGGVDSKSPIYLSIAVGFLGGYTTFSAFALEVVRHLEMGRPFVTLLYGFQNVVGAVGGCALGYYLRRLILP